MMVTEENHDITLSGSCNVRYDSHGHWTVDRRCKTMDEPDDDERIIALYPEIGEGHEGEEEEADEHCPLPADDVRESAGWQFEEDARYRRDARGEPDGFGSSAEIEGKEGQHRAPRKGIGQPCKETHGAECGEG
jgi:hypothetical protein